MTISSTTRIAGPFLSGTALPVTFKVFTAADLEVVRLNTSTGVETSLVLGSDYTVALNGNQNTNPGGTVNLTVAASATSTVTITSDIANLQPTDLTNQGGFYPEVITDALDRATIQIQQMSEDVGRSLKGPISDGSLNMELQTAALRANKYLVFDANGLPITSTGSGTDTALRTDLANTGIITAGAGLVGFRNADASSVGRTVLSKLRDVVSVKDFGAVGDGVADDTTAIANSIAAAAGKTLTLPPGTYLVDAFDMSTNKPVAVLGPGATIKARTVTAGALVLIENPHAGTNEAFRFDVKMVDADGKATYAVRIHGGQNMQMSFSAKNATSHGVWLDAASGYGIYYSRFSIDSTYNGGSGVFMETTDAAYRIANNVFMGVAQNNLSHGWSMNYAQNTFVGCGAELNNGFGFNVDFSLSNDFCGGYSENNHQNEAQGGTTDGSPDESFNLTANAARTKILGGRHIGAISGTTTGVGKLLLPSAAAFDGFALEGTMATSLPGTLKTAGGLGVNGATPAANTINITGTGSPTAFSYIQTSGTTAAQFGTDQSVRALGPLFASGVAVGLYAGSGTPEGVVTANKSSIFLRTDGTAGSPGTLVYLKETGTGNTGWVAKW